MTHLHTHTHTHTHTHMQTEKAYFEIILPKEYGETSKPVFVSKVSHNNGSEKITKYIAVKRYPVIFDPF